MESNTYFLDMIREVFALTISTSAGNSAASIEHFNKFLDTAKAVCVMATVPVAQPPTLVIHEDTAGPNIVVVKETMAPSSAAASDKIVKIELAQPTHTVHVEETSVEEETAEEEDEEADLTLGIDVNEGLHSDDSGEEEETEETEEEEEEGEAVAEEEVVAETAAAAAEDGEVIEEETVEEAEEEAVEEEVAEEEAEEVEEEAAEEETAEEEVVEEEAAEEEEEAGLVEIQIGKKKYFFDEAEQLVYVRISEDEAGDCLGRLENGKIIPL